MGKPRIDPWSAEGREVKEVAAYLVVLPWPKPMRHPKTGEMLTAYKGTTTGRVQAWFINHCVFCGRQHMIKDGRAIPWDMPLNRPHAPIVLCPNWKPSKGPPQFIAIIHCFPHKWPKVMKDYVWASLNRRMERKGHL